MKEKTTAEVQDLIGQPTYALVNGKWVPPPDRKLFTRNEFFELFRDESVLFIGDSTQRRAADTLHLLIENRNNFTDRMHYLYDWKYNKMHHSRVFGKRPNVTISAYNDLTHTRGRIDNRMDQFYRSIKSFRYGSRRKYTTIVVGVGAWDNQKLGHTSNELVSLVNETIHHLHREIPSSVQILWKTAGWGSWFDWGYEEPEVETKCNNYHIYLVNKVAKDVIESIDADNLKLLDWSREILPYSFERLEPSGMKAEKNFNGRPDNNPWHIGVKGRMLLLQMLAWEVNQRKELVPVAIGTGIDATVTASSSSPTSTPSSAKRSGNAIANSTILVQTTTPSYGHELPSERKDVLPQGETNWEKFDETEFDLVVGSDHSLSYLRKLPAEKRISQGQELLSLFVVLLSVAVILVRTRQHEDHRIRRIRPTSHV